MMITNMMNLKMIDVNVKHISPIPRKFNEPKKLNEAERVIYTNFLNECKCKLVRKKVEHKCNKNIWGIWMEEMY